VLAAADPAEPGALSRTVGALHVAELKRRAERSERPAEAAAAARTLNTLLAQTGFYLPREYATRGEYARAAFFLGVATEIAPQDPGRWVRLAAARARTGQKAGALAALERARAEGFRDAAALENDEAFAPLRGEKRFRALLSALRGS
jgi:predicted Zn-dependent protease